MKCRTMNTGQDSRPCPFCGSKRVFVDALLLDTVRWFVTCADCGGTGPAMAGAAQSPDRSGLGPDLAVRAWSGAVEKTFCMGGVS